MQYDEAKNILGAMCAAQEDKTMLWYVNMPQVDQLGDTFIELCLVVENETDLNEYMLAPTDPVVCLPDQDVLMNASMEDQQL